MTARYELALSACEWRIIYREGHFNCRLGYLYKRYSLKVAEVTDSVTDSDVLDTADTNDVASLCTLTWNSVKSFYLIHCNDLATIFLLSLMIVADRNVLINFHFATLDTADSYSSYILVVVDSGNKILHWALSIYLRCRDIAEYLVKERYHILALFIWRMSSCTCSA